MGSGNGPEITTVQRNEILNQKSIRLDEFSDQSKELLRMNEEERANFYKDKTAKELKISANKLLKSDDKRLTTKNNIEKRIELRIREIKALAKIGREPDPKPPHRNLKANEMKNVVSDEQENYFNQVRQASINQKKLQQFEKEIIDQQSINKAETREPSLKLHQIRDKFDRKYSRFEQDSFLLALERKRIIEIQTASDAKLLTRPGTTLPSRQRGVLNYVIVRN